MLRFPARMLLFPFCLLLFLLVNCSTVQFAHGDIALTVNNQGTTGFNGNWTLGYEFTANVDMEVTSLGFFDRDQDGLSQSHNVGIWDAAGNLLVTTTVGNTDPLTGFFRFNNVAPIILASGQNYVIGGFDYTPDDAIRSDLGGVSLSTSSDISIVTGRWLSGGSLTFPTNTINSSIFYPTVTFQFDTVAIPEPTSIGIVLVVAGLVCRRRRS